MPEKNSKTEYAPAERADKKELERQVKIFSENQVLKNIGEAISNMLVILNKQRQIVYSNSMFLELLQNSDSSEIIGKRTGEATNCIHAASAANGCGTTEFCRTCGGVNAILEAQQGKQSTKECRIVTTNNDALDLRVTATPYIFNEEEFTIFAINDISHEKRRQTLERVFFHDVLNSAGGIQGLAKILQNVRNTSEIAEIAGLINRTAENLVDEIEAQRLLSTAERNDYQVSYSTVSSFELLEQIAEVYLGDGNINNKQIVIDPQSKDIAVETDIILLRRILANMIKNAVEASLPTATITLSCFSENNSVQFSVHNSNFIERKSQLQLFKRSFSTKGIGRGLGTFSMKLFGERYLQGKVWFESSVDKGTTFYIEIPVKKHE